MSNSLIGCSLDSLHLDENLVPTFIPVVQEFISKFSSTVGVFRVSGNHKIISELHVLLNFKECSIPPCASVHDVAGFLKSWLKSLPEPLITPAVFNEFFIPDNEESVKEVISRLYITNRRVLAYVFRIIYDVYEKSSINQMTIPNISTCFQTSLTQESNGLEKHLPFKFFLLNSIQFLNPDGYDFNFE